MLNLANLKVPHKTKNNKIAMFKVVKSNIIKPKVEGAMPKETRSAKESSCLPNSVGLAKKPSKKSRITAIRIRTAPITKIPLINKNIAKVPNKRLRNVKISAKLNFIEITIKRNK